MNFRIQYFTHFNTQGIEWARPCAIKETTVQQREPDSSPSSRHSQPQPPRMRLLGKLRSTAAGSTASEPAFSNVLTPGRIPEFCIPPRLPGLAGGAPEPRAVGCRLSLVLQPPGTTRKRRSAVGGRSRKAAFDQDFCFDGLTEDELRRLAVRVKAEGKGRGLERGRLLGQGELPLGSLLLL
ncbi:PREDICTED: C2 calcium-dependent domain-containing protein 4B-like [Galeopterus variegatus]|uniref:C2 calcium-dependent domain-containing protein 4B-like n=1 Tax=Galeopterus variegatus TaxID=482537 RepID=A0ABM0SI38_GALVR|nr:PREDICTED: C2 calcium-dependent domain-containing protein 4B-like [Galeopterus variegatus]